MSSRLWLIWLLASLISGPCFAQKPAVPPAIQAHVDQIINDYYASRDEKRLDESADPVEFDPIDVNADGITDWRIQYGTIGMCGTGGCLNEIQVSRPDGAFDLALHRQLLTIRIQPDEFGFALLRVALHGGFCMGHAETECVLGYRWDERHHQFVDAMLQGTQSRRYDFSMLDHDHGLYPFNASSALGDAQAFCKHYRPTARPVGFKAERIVDFDDDGRLDWLVGQGAYCSQDGVEQGPAVPVSLWFDRETTPALAATITGGVAFVDVSGRRPVLATDCEAGDDGCSALAYVWSPETRSMQRIEPAHLQDEDAAFLAAGIAGLVPGNAPPPVPDNQTLAHASALTAHLERTAAPTDPLLARARLLHGAMLTLAGQPGGLEPLRQAARQLAADSEAFRLASIYRARAARETGNADDRYYGARDAIENVGDGALDEISRRGVELAIEEGINSGWAPGVGSYVIRREDLVARPGSWVEPGILEAYRAELARAEARYAEAADIETASLERMTNRQSVGASVLHAGLAKSLLGLGRLDEAEDHARAALRIRTEQAGPRTTESLEAQAKLAALLLSVRKTSEAEALLRDAVGTLRAQRADNYMLARVLRQLAEAAIDADRIREAAQLLAAAAEEESRLAKRDVIDPAYSIFEVNEVPRLLARTHLALGNPSGISEMVELVTRSNYVANIELGSISVLLDAIEYGGPAFSAEQRAAIAASIDAPGDQWPDIAKQAVDIVEQALPASHPWVARALRLLARALVHANGTGAENAVTAALKAARAQQHDGYLNGLEIRNDAVRFHLARDGDVELAQALALAREAVTIARNRRAALGSTSATGMTDPEARRAFIGLVAVVAVEQRRHAQVDPALADEAFQAFQEAEQSLAAVAMRRNLLRALAESSNDERIASLFSRFRDAERRYDALGQLYLTALTTTSGGDVSSLLQRQSQERGVMVQAALELEAALPLYRETALSVPLTLAEAQRRLAARQGLYLLGSDGQDLVAMLIGPSGPRFILSQGGAQGMARDSRRLRCMLDDTFCSRSDQSAINADLLRAKTRADGSRPFDLSAATRIGAAILAPMAERLSELDTLYVIQQGRTADLPLAIIPLAHRTGDDPFNPSRMDGVDWLIDRVAIVQLPSANLLARVPMVHKGGLNRTFVGIGNPALLGQRPPIEGLGAVMPATSPGGEYLADVVAIAALPPLPEAQRELESVADLPGIRARLFTGPRATEARVKSDRTLRRADMITFATHGLLPGDFDGLAEPGLVLTPPVRGSLLDDGLLLASEVARLELLAQQVVLSACNTASANGPPGADSLSVLARSFLIAGAQSVIASRWSLMDDAAAALNSIMASRRAANPLLTSAAALREAMIAVREGHTADGKAVPAWDSSWKHPRAWGPFILVASSD